MASPFYTTGTISIDVGDEPRLVIGSGTAWETAGVMQGDRIKQSGTNLFALIDAVNSNGELELAEDWPGVSDLSGASYIIELCSPLRLDPLGVADRQNRLLRQVEILNAARVAVLHFGIPAPVGDEEDGDFVVVADEDATGPFAGKENRILRKNGSSWDDLYSDIFLPGWEVRVEDTMAIYAWDGEAWGLVNTTTIAATGGLESVPASGLSAPAIHIRGVVSPEDFGWEPEADLAPYLRDAFEECKDSNIKKEIRLTRDRSSPDGSYTSYSPSPDTDNRCVYLEGSDYSGIKLIGLGRHITRIKYNHTLGLTSRSILSATGCDLFIEGMSFDGAEAERIAILTTLNGSISDTDVSITLTSAASFASSGFIKIENEWIGYTGKSTNTLTGCIRGVQGTTAASHANGVSISQLTQTGHHPLGIGNFRSLRLHDIGVFNSPSYGLGIENTESDYMEDLDIDRLWIENCASDALDIKCPVTNGNKYAKLRNLTIAGWGRENGWITTADQGLDIRVPGAIVSAVDFIFKPYQGSSNAINIRDNQASNYSGAQFSLWDNINFHGATLTGTAVPTHTGISDSGGAIITNLSARNLAGYVGAIRGTRVSKFKIDACKGGFSLNGTAGARLTDGTITNCLGEAVYAQNGSSDNLVENVDALNNYYGFRTTGTGAMTVRDCKASGNSPDGGATNRDYLLTANCTVEKTRGAFRAVTSNYTVTEDDDTIFIDTTSGSVTLTLPHATQRVPGREYVFMKTGGSNAVILDPTGSIQINGAPTLSFSETGREVRARSDGTMYRAHVAAAGPSSATDGHFAQFDGASGKTLKGGLSLDTDTALAADSDTRIPSQKAVKAHVSASISSLVAAAPGALDTLDELAAALGDDANFATTVTNALAGKAPIASPTFTGTPAAPTASAGTNTTQVATTAYVVGAVAGKQAIWIDAAEMIPTLTNGAMVNLTETSTNDCMLETLDFDTTTQEHATFRRKLPKSWDEGTITFIPHWTADSGTVSNTVEFGLQAVAVSNDDALDATWGTGQVSNDALIATGDHHVGPESSAITIGGTPAEGDIILFRVYRNVANDNLAADARLLGIELFITTNAAVDS
jgi:hypothetical protein